MLTQTIFFIALAVFIYLLARRYSLKSEQVNKMLMTTRNLAVSATKFVIIQVSKMHLPKIKVPKIKSNAKKVASHIKTGSNDLETNSDFWNEDVVADKPELSSHFEEGEQLLKKGKHKDAEQFFLKAATNNPGDPKVYARLGLLYLEQKNFSDAIEALKVAVKLEKYNPSRHYNLALAYWGNKDTQRSIYSVREAISLDPITKKYRKLLEQLLNG